ncbi:type II toxin-antitoxin system HicA family toxin [Buttiauxella gaviniae]|uniref:Type II toxin-antitoxin system HicA family toxin n=1 Tax=Buttiauxella gaviniae TaxID=82990 RepID=A0ABV3NT40_9ENTR
MKRQHQRTLEAIYRRPVAGSLEWRDFKALMISLGAEVDVSAAGSREAFTLREEVRVYHRPHPHSTMDKGAVNATRIWLESMGIKP